MQLVLVSFHIEPDYYPRWLILQHQQNSNKQAGITLFLTGTTCNVNSDMKPRATPVPASDGLSAVNIGLDEGPHYISCLNHKPMFLIETLTVITSNLLLAGAYSCEMGPDQKQINNAFLPASGKEAA